MVFLNTFFSSLYHEMATKCFTMYPFLSLLGNNKGRLKSLDGRGHFKTDINLLEKKEIYMCNIKV